MGETVLTWDGFQYDNGFIWNAWNANIGYDTTGIWNAWNGNIASGSTNAVWTNWIATADTTGWVVADTAWPNWVNATGSTVVTNVVWPAWVEQHELTQEERDRQQAERERHNRQAIEYQRAVEARAEARRKELEAEHARAKRLLNSILNVHQRKQMKDRGHFEVVTSSGKRYRIKKGTHGNVRLLDNQGREINSYCIAPVNASAVPDEDSMVAQKLMLETDEEKFLRIASARRLAA